MNKNKILRASNALWRLEKAQQQFNEAVDNLSNDELEKWCIDNSVTIEVSNSKKRIEQMLNTKKA
jgi:hypothetical protein